MYAASILYVVWCWPVLFLFPYPAGPVYRAGRGRSDRLLTASSEAALPLALENMEQFGVPKHIVGL